MRTRAITVMGPKGEVFRVRRMPHSSYPMQPWAVTVLDARHGMAERVVFREPFLSKAFDRLGSVFTAADWEDTPESERPEES